MAIKTNLEKLEEVQAAISAVRIDESFLSGNVSVSLSCTTQIYTHIDFAKKRRAIKRLE